jgi:hypothetical protein
MRAALDVARQPAGTVASPLQPRVRSLAHHLGWLDGTVLRMAVPGNGIAGNAWVCWTHHDTGAPTIDVLIEPAD